MEHELNTHTCPKCGYKNTPEAISCARCNTPLKPSTMPVPDMIDASSIEEDDPTPEVKEKDRGIALWVRSHARPILVSGGAILGRKVGEEDNDALLDLTDYNGYKLGVSRRHAQIDCTGQGCLLLDLGSSNGTWINGLRLQPYQPAVLRSGDRIYLARLEIIVGPISDEALRRARHIPHGMPESSQSPLRGASVPSDRKTDSLDPGPKKATVPVENVPNPASSSIQPTASKDNSGPKAADSAAESGPKAAELSAESGPKETIVARPNGNGSKPAESAAAKDETASDAAPKTSGDVAKPESKDDSKPEAKNGTAPDKPGDQS